MHVEQRCIHELAHLFVHVLISRFVSVSQNAFQALHFQVLHLNLGGHVTGEFTSTNFTLLETIPFLWVVLLHDRLYCNKLDEITFVH
jgi:hypothetical protein